MHDAATAPRVTFQGEAGAYGEDAVVQRWGSDARALPTRTFTEALTRVVMDDADCAVIPVWNSTVGDVAAAIAALEAETERLMVVEQMLVPVRHCLLALPGTTVDDIRHVGSHPIALKQCTRFFDEHPAVTAREAYDTGGAARELAGHASHLVSGERSAGLPWYGGLTGAAASQLAVIASARAAEHHGLQLLIPDIQNDPGNTTCFVVVRPREIGRW